MSRHRGLAWTIASALAPMLYAAPIMAGSDPPPSGPIVNPVRPLEIDTGPVTPELPDPSTAVEDADPEHPESDPAFQLNDTGTPASTDDGAVVAPGPGDEAAGAQSDDTVATTPAEPPAQESLPLGKSASNAAYGAAEREARGAGRIGGGSSRGGGWMTQTGAALAAVIGLIVLGRFALVALARRTGGLAAMLGAGGRAPSGVMEILARYPVSRGHTLVLLKVDRRVLVLCHTSSGFTTLTEFIEPEEVASILMRVRDDEGESMAARFNDLLQQMGDTTEPSDDGPVSPRMVLTPNGGKTLAEWPPTVRAGGAS